jgi:hypothetical protein
MSMSDKNDMENSLKARTLCQGLKDIVDVATIGFCWALKLLAPRLLQTVSAGEKASVMRRVHNVEGLTEITKESSGNRRGHG